MQRGISVHGNGRVHFRGPGIDAAGQIEDPGEAALFQEYDDLTAPSAMVTEHDDFLVPVEVVQPVRQPG